MRQALHRLTVATNGQGLVDVTGKVVRWVKAQGIQTGLLTIWCRHTSASLLVQENTDPDVRADLEAFFRRLVYDVLVPVGAGFAIGGTALLFALVHLSVYGAWVLPIDAAAGLVFGWQRWASGRWSVPAATHVLANVLVVV